MILLNLTYLNIVGLLLIGLAILLKFKIRLAIMIELMVLAATLFIFILSKNQRKSMFETLVLRKYFRKSKKRFETDEEWDEHKAFINLMEVRFKNNELIFSINIENIEIQKQWEAIEGDVYKYLIDNFENYQFTKSKNIIKGVFK